MRFVVYGAGAVGGVVAARLHLAGHDVTAIARGAQLEAIRTDGLTLRTPEGPIPVPLPVVAHPGELDLRGDEVVLLTVKSQDTAGAVRDLALVADPATAVVCLQNGVANEVMALRSFDRVYGAVAMVPATFLEPGIVVCHSSPHTGVIDLGRFPRGSDERATKIADAFAGATFDVRVADDVMRSKYGKLLDNLTNAIEALCGAAARSGRLAELAQEEAMRCYEAADLEWSSSEERRGRRAGLQVVPVDGEPRRGASAWQSIARGRGEVETDYLNGEIVRLGRLHGVATPTNLLLQRLANLAAARRVPPEAWEQSDLIAAIERDDGSLPPHRHPS